MIRKVDFIICLLLIIIVSSGCNNVLQDTSEPTNGISIEALNPSGINSEVKYDIYEMDTEKSVFNVAIIENAIDKAYNEEIDRAGTIDEMVQIENKYISIWQKEMDSTISKYKDALLDKERNDFDKTQKLFDEYVQNAFAFESKMLLQNEYNIHIGESSKWLLYVEMKNVIRERTIHVKYLHFLLERAMMGNKAEFTALTFGRTEDGSLS